MRRGTVVLVMCVALVGLASASARADTLRVTVLTYNVAGLPLGLSSSNPELNSLQISPLLNAFDLVLVQEDFGYHEDITAQLTFPHQSVKDAGFGVGAHELAAQLGIEPEDLLDPALLGSGLERFSRSPFEDHTRVPWGDCFGVLDSGSDCLAPKGFSLARHELAPGAFVDVYNLHADAGGGALDLEARRANVRQLTDYIEIHSAGHAVLVLGDTNSRYTHAGDILPEMVSTLGLTDVWVELARGGAAPEPGTDALRNCALDPSAGDCEVVDKIFFRSGEGVTVTALDYAVPPEFVDGNGLPLSDHLPIAATFEITVPEAPASALLAAALCVLVLARRSGEPV